MGSSRATQSRGRLLRLTGFGARAVALDRCQIECPVGRRSPSTAVVRTRTRMLPKPDMYATSPRRADRSSWNVMGGSSHPRGTTADSSVRGSGSPGSALRARLNRLPENTSINGHALPIPNRLGGGLRMPPIESRPDLIYPRNVTSWRRWRQARRRSRGRLSCIWSYR